MTRQGDPLSNAWASGSSSVSASPSCQSVIAFGETPTSERLRERTRESGRVKVRGDEDRDQGACLDDGARIVQALSAFADIA